MKNFKDLGIKAQVKSFVGKKIKISKVLNRPIKVLDFKIDESIYGENKLCLHLQIEFEKEKRVIFTGSNTLMNMIKQVQSTDFPFQTTIVEEDERFEFR